MQRKELFKLAQEKNLEWDLFLSIYWFCEISTTDKILDLILFLHKIKSWKEKEIENENSK